MQLTGTIEERIHAVVEFGRAHRTPQYDEKYAEEIYEKAGAPFTDAARKFWSEWSGVTDEMSFYSRNPSIPSDGGRKFTGRIYFDFYCLNEQGLRDWYIPTTYPEEDEGFPDLAGIMRAKYGDDTVPVAEGGYYYQWRFWIRPDGKMIAILPDNGIEYYFDTVEEFLCWQLKDHNPGWLEVTTERMKLTGTLEERMNAVIDFARKHDGFEHCRVLEDGWVGRVVDLSKLNGCMELSDEEIFDLLYQALNAEVPKYRMETLMPGSIEAVVE